MSLPNLPLMTLEMTVRYFDKRCDIINCGDSFGTIESYAEAIENNKNKFCIFGSICEPHETMWRIRGTEGLLLDLALFS